MKTYGARHWRAAQAAWTEGGFGPEWDQVRTAAARRGMIYPPEGSRDDSWEDARPSQRAILIREVRDRPRHLLDVIRRSRSWSQVIAVCLRHFAELREEVGIDGMDAPSEARRRKREDAEIVGRLMRRIAEETADEPGASRIREDTSHG
jgi:hypothetical protein